MHPLHRPSCSTLQPGCSSPVLNQSTPSRYPGRSSISRKASSTSARSTHIDNRHRECFLGLSPSGWPCSPTFKTAMQRGLEAVIFASASSLAIRCACCRTSSLRFLARTRNSNSTNEKILPCLCIIIIGRLSTESPESPPQKLTLELVQIHVVPPFRHLATERQYSNQSLISSKRAPSPTYPGSPRHTPPAPPHYPGEHSSPIP